MTNGYVYILINNSMPGLIKIGRTKREPRERARELSTTSVPTPFQVAFEIFSDDCEKLEKDIHSELENYIISSNREFYRYPLHKAIEKLQKLNSPVINEESKYFAEDILDRLRKKYPNYLKPEIVAVRIVQPKDRVWLEITFEKEIDGRLKNQTIKRTDLGFIVGDKEKLYFDPNKNSISENANKFIKEFDAYSIINTTDLFHEKACQEIAMKFEQEDKT